MEKILKFGLEICQFYAHQNYRNNQRYLVENTKDTFIVLKYKDFVTLPKKANASTNVVFKGNVYQELATVTMATQEKTVLKLIVRVDAMVMEFARMKLVNVMKDEPDQIVAQRR